ncbi:MAG: tetratricopeptide repeat protein [Desulfomonilia bacterium]|nr:tetratricopeptide repeat protein [Desulfomonilia bacterium]
MISVRTLAFILIAAMSLAACAHLPQAGDEPLPLQTNNARLIMLLARYEENQGNWDSALELYSRVPDPVALLAQARIYFVLNQPRPALETLHRIIEEGTYRDEALEIRSKIYAKAGQWQLAIDDTESLLFNHPDNQQLLMFLANLKIVVGQFQQSRTILESILGTPDDSMTLYTLSKACFAEKDLDCAKESLRKVIEIRPDFTPAYLDMGRIHDMLEEPELVERIYLDLLQISPSSIEAHRELTDYYITQKRYQDALIHLNALHEISPSDQLTRKLIIVYLQEGMHEIALTHISTLEEPSQDDRYYHAIALTGMGRFEHALNILDEIIPADKLLCDVTMLKASILRDMGKPDESVKVLSLAWEHLPTRDTCNEIGHQLATELDSIGKREEGLEIALFLLEKNPHDAIALNLVGYVWADSGIHLEEAYRMIREALDQKPDDPYILDSMAWVLYRMGRYHEALGFIEQSVEILSSDPIINEHMGDILMSLGKKDRALDYYLKSSLFKKTPSEELQEKIRLILE